MIDRLTDSHIAICCYKFEEKIAHVKMKRDRFLGLVEILKIMLLCNYIGHKKHFIQLVKQRFGGHLTYRLRHKKPHFKATTLNQVSISCLKKL